MHEEVKSMRGYKSSKGSLKITTEKSQVSCQLGSSRDPTFSPTPEALKDHLRLGVGIIPHTDRNITTITFTHLYELILTS